MPNINLDDAYVLDETGEQVDKTTGIPFKDESLTEAEAAQARENIRAGGTNPNLLDNPWFTVRQRGDGPFSANTPAVDRWRTTSNATITATANGITLTTTVRTWGMVQRVEKGFFTVGKTYTISAMEQDGTITSASFEWKGSDISRYVPGANVGFEISVSSSAYEQIYITTNYTGDVYLKAVKLELGSVSTLANDAPPNYVEELTKCKAYFERIGSANRATYGYFGTGVAYDTTHAIIIVPMTPKIGDFSITSGGSFRLQNGGAVTVTSLAFSGSRMTNTAGVLATASGLTAGSAYLLQANNDSTAHIDINLNGI